MAETAQRTAGGGAHLHHLPPYGRGTLYNHMQLQPVIHVDSAAGTAKARWRTFMMVGRLGAEARWGRGLMRMNMSGSTGNGGSFCCMAI